MNSMKCFYCKGKMSAGFTTHVVDFGKGVIIIRNVPCEKCNQCGETVFAGAIVKKIEEIVDSLKNSLTEVAIVNFSEKAA